MTTDKVKEAMNYLGPRLVMMEMERKEITDYKKMRLNTFDRESIQTLLTLAQSVLDAKMPKADDVKYTQCPCEKIVEHNQMLIDDFCLWQMKRLEKRES